MEKVKRLYYNNKKFIHSSFISIICTCIRFTIYFLVLWITTGKYILANFISYIISFTILFYCNQKLFKSKPNTKKEEIKQLLSFVLFRVIGFVIDSMLLAIFIEILYFSNLISRILSSLITFIYNYKVNKIWNLKFRIQNSNI